MLFSFQFLNHSINKVGEIPCYFLQKSIEKDVYEDSVFPEWFRAVIINLRGLNLKFEDVFNEIQKLKKNKLQDLVKLSNDLDAGYNISLLCDTTNFELPKTAKISKPFHEKLKTLYGTFFNETLKDSKKLAEALGTDFQDHYRSFRRLNLEGQGKVCLMCGLHEYPLSAVEPKAQYDHWLPQDIYPLLAINFNNLVPICGYCNQIKTNNDLLTVGNQRTVSFYPYQNNDGIDFRVTSYVPFERLDVEDQKIYKYGKHEIESIPLNLDDQLRVESWNRIFKIPQRNSIYLNDYFDEIKEDVLEYATENGMQFQDGTDKMSLSYVVDQFILKKIKRVRKEKGAHLKKAYLNFICVEGNEYLLYTLFGLKIKAA